MTRQRLRAGARLVVLGALALGGCGGSGKAPGTLLTVRVESTGATRVSAHIQVTRVAAREAPLVTRDVTMPRGRAKTVARFRTDEHRVRIGVIVRDVPKDRVTGACTRTQSLDSSAVTIVVHIGSRQSCVVSTEGPA